MAKGKRIPGLNCSAPADKMIQFVLRTQLRAMCALRDQALDSNDPDGVHDMRVASRRLRSAISDFKPFLRKPALPIAKLRAIAKSLGAVRDEDVALAALGDLQTKATGEAAEGIELLVGERRERRAKAQVALEKAIKRSAVAEFRKEFAARLGAATVVPSKQGRTEAPASEFTFGQVGNEVIKARIKEFRDASPCIYAPLQIKELHELRILAKRLRYATQLFGQCREKTLDEFATEISHLQTSLGELHDCDVWIESLSERLQKHARKVRTNPDKIRQKEAAAWLVRYFSRERMEHYRDALARWQQWEADAFLDRLTLALNAKSLGESQRIHSPLSPA